LLVPQRSASEIGSSPRTPQQPNDSLRRIPTPKPIRHQFHELIAAPEPLCHSEVVSAPYLALAALANIPHDRAVVRLAFLPSTAFPLARRVTTAADVHADLVVVGKPSAELFDWQELLTILASFGWGGGSNHGLASRTVLISITQTEHRQRGICNRKSSYERCFSSASVVRYGGHESDCGV
jgi:hypothetical protein